MTSLVNLAVLVLDVTAIDCLSSPYCQRLPGTQRNIFTNRFSFLALYLVFPLCKETGEILLVRNQTRVHGTGLCRTNILLIDLGILKVVDAFSCGQV